MGNAITALNWPLKSDFLEILDGDLGARGIGYTIIIIYNVEI